MLSKIPSEYIDLLSVRDLEELLEKKRRDGRLRDLMQERDRLQREMDRVNEEIQSIEDERVRNRKLPSPTPPIPDTRRRTLKDYIAEILREAGKPLSPTEIQKRLPEVGYSSSSSNPRSFYNTVFQALQRYDVFVKEDKRYRLRSEEPAGDGAKVGMRGRLKDYVIAVLKEAGTPLKVSEITSRVLIAGYKTDLGPDALGQRVSAVLKKSLNKDFDWDSQRYCLAHRG
ncbi:MAG: hypothetical protein JXP34_10135 [Planctomycetes bacterium]|nr:hypothetical protein [Planctomycetota bacterium]